MLCKSTSAALAATSCWPYSSCFAPSVAPIITHVLPDIHAPNKWRNHRHLSRFSAATGYAHLYSHACFLTSSDSLLAPLMHFSVPAHSPKLHARARQLQCSIAWWCHRPTALSPPPLAHQQTTVAQSLKTPLYAPPAADARTVKQLRQLVRLLVLEEAAMQDHIKRCGGPVHVWAAGSTVWPGLSCC